MDNLDIEIRDARRARVNQVADLNNIGVIRLLEALGFPVESWSRYGKTATSGPFAVAHIPVGTRVRADVLDAIECGRADRPIIMFRSGGHWQVSVHTDLGDAAAPMPT